jgi:ribosomal protein S18 acetylase RimI-like enzyme
MNRRRAVSIRKAVAEDAAELAVLMNSAGEGIPAYLWSRMAEPGMDIMEFGAQRVARTEGGFSFRNVHVAAIDLSIAGMLLSYRLPDPYDLDDLDQYPEVVRPLVELEAQVPGSWYINAVATAESCRGRGVGKGLMALAEDLAQQAGASTLSLIVAEHNLIALNLYKKLGYQTLAARRGLPIPGSPDHGSWLLMTRPV